jgi:hypothetical protein
VIPFDCGSGSASAIKVRFRFRNTDSHFMPRFLVILWLCAEGGQYDLHAAYGQLKAEDTAPVAGDPWLQVDCSILTPRHEAER